MFCKKLKIEKMENKKIENKFVDIIIYKYNTIYI